MVVLVRMKRPTIFLFRYRSVTSETCARGTDWQAAISPAIDAGSPDLHPPTASSPRAGSNERRIVKLACALLRPTTISQHDTIAVFRQTNKAAFQQVLLLAREASLLRRGPDGVLFRWEEAGVGNAATALVEV